MLIVASYAALMALMQSRGTLALTFAAIAGTSWAGILLLATRHDVRRIAIVSSGSLFGLFVSFSCCAPVVRSASHSIVTYSVLGIVIGGLLASSLASVQNAVDPDAETNNKCNDEHDEQDNEMHDEQYGKEG